MSAYLHFFELERSPFEGEQPAQVVLGTRALREAFASICEGLDGGYSRICVSGGRGMGKSSLARALPKLLAERARVALVQDPSASWATLREPIAKQWGLARQGLARQQLIERARERRLVLVIDSAEQADEEFLDHLDVLLSYRRADDAPAIHCVLLARLSEGRRPGETPPPLIWWLDRIQTLQLEFAPLPREGVHSYIRNHLKRAGWRGGELFHEDAAHAIHEAADGVPGRISALCEALLEAAADEDTREIDAAFVRSQLELEPATQAGPSVDDVRDARASAAASALGLRDATEQVAEKSTTSPIPARERGPGALDELLLEQVVSARAEPAPVSAIDATKTDPAFETGADSTTGPAPGATPASTASAVMRAAAASALAQETEDGEPEDSLEAFLSRPATPEELRALVGGGMTRQLKAIAAAAAVAVIGGLALAFVFAARDADEPGTAPAVAGRAANEALASLEREDDERVWVAQQPGPDGGEGEPVVLARIRGPVTAAEPPTRESRAPTDASSGAPAPLAPPPTDTSPRTPSQTSPAGGAPRPAGETPLEALARQGGPLVRAADAPAAPAYSGPAAREENEAKRGVQIDARPSSMRDGGSGDPPPNRGAR